MQRSRAEIVVFLVVLIQHILVMLFCGYVNKVDLCISDLDEAKAEVEKLSKSVPQKEAECKDLQAQVI